MPVIARLTGPTLRTAGSTDPQLARGAKGPAVETLQRLLQRAGVPTGPVDGDFGPMTAAAVRRFQASRGLAADGVVGPGTWQALRQAPTAPTPSGAGQPTLRTGDFGAEVETLQRALVKHGFDPAGIDGQFGPGTRAAVVQFQRAKGLAADGVVGAGTWRALEGPATVAPVKVAPAGDFRARVLEAARREVGVTERGANRGDALKYPQFFGRGAEAWCADFTSYVLRQAGGTMNDPSCPSVVNQLKRDGGWKGRANPEPGDLVLFDWDGDRRADHIGIVERINADGSLTTIEGNTPHPQSGVEGVWRKTRQLRDVLGFGAPY